MEFANDGDDDDDDADDYDCDGRKFDWLIVVCWTSCARQIVVIAVACEQNSSRGLDSRGAVVKWPCE